MTDEEISNIANSYEYDNNFIHKIGSCYLTNSEIEILNRYNIDYLRCHNNHELLYLVEECLETMSADDLEWLSSTLAERSYYFETNK